MSDEMLHLKNGLSTPFSELVLELFSRSLEHGCLRTVLSASRMYA